jgi:hypothetical protein
MCEHGKAEGRRQILCVQSEVGAHASPQQACEQRFVAGGGERSCQEAAARNEAEDPRRQKYDFIGDLILALHQLAQVAVRGKAYAVFAGAGYGQSRSDAEDLEEELDLLPAQLREQRGRLEKPRTR